MQSSAYFERWNDYRIGTSRYATSLNQRLTFFEQYRYGILPFSRFVINKIAVRELTSPRLDWPRVGLSSNCPVSLRTASGYCSLHFSRPVEPQTQKVATKNFVRLHRVVSIALSYTVDRTTNQPLADAIPFQTQRPFFAVFEQSVSNSI